MRAMDGKLFVVALYYAGGYKDVRIILGFSASSTGKKLRKFSKVEEKNPQIKRDSNP